MNVYNIGNLVSQLNIGAKRRYRFIFIKKIKIYLDIIHILYVNGFIRTYHIKGNLIRVYFKYTLGQKFWRELQIISRPGKRVYWSLPVLTKNYNKNNFTGFYIISTSEGLLTSNSILLNKHISGEVLIKVIL